MRGRALVHWGLLGACLGAVGVMVNTGQPASAQTEVERFERQLEQIQRDTRLRVDTNLPVEERVLLDYGGYVTLSFLSVDDQENENHVLRQYDLNGYARLNIDGVHDFFLRVRTSYSDFNGGVAGDGTNNGKIDDSFDGNGDDWVEPTLDRATYRFDLARYFAAYQGKAIDYNIVVQGGRQLVHWANGLVLSMDLDGGMISFSKDPWRLDILGGTTRDSDNDFDSSRPQFDTDTHRNWYGGMISYQASPKHRPFFYGLVQTDENADRTTVDGNGNTAHFNYDSYYIGIGSNGNFSDQLLYGLEMVYEGGSTLSAPTADGQEEDDISAFALDVSLDYLLNDQNRSRLSGEIILATGDNDRDVSSTTVGGNRAGTTDHGFNAFGLINSGLAFGPSVSNIFIVRLGASTFPLPTNKLFNRLQVGGNFLIFNKLQKSGPIDETTDDDNYLGVEPDVYATWQITSDLSLAVRYGVFFPGGSVESGPAARQFFYSGLTFAF